MAENLSNYIEIIKKYSYSDYSGMFREAGGAFKYPFLTPGSQQYSDILWDWDSWLSNIALRQILKDIGDAKAREEALKYEQGCILNYLEWTKMDGWMPITVSRKDIISQLRPENIYKQNMHKPVIAQHAAFLVKENGGDAEWLRDSFYYLQTFLNNYKNHHRHQETGLYYWQTDFAIGVDNDPCTYYRPPGSSASIFLNCLMAKELKAMVYLCEHLNLDEIAAQFLLDAEALAHAIQEHCWDARDGFFYSVDINLVSLQNREEIIGGFMPLHAGQPRDWHCLIQRIGVWSGFLAMWAGIATAEQAQEMVALHYNNPKTFHAPYGIRTLSKMEKMYNLKASGNPSSWLGPIWGISNYLVFRALLTYGFTAEAKELAEKTIVLFGRDFERFGGLHEYYQPENGEPILNRGFQNWNYLVINMINWLENKPTVWEF